MAGEQQADGSDMEWHVRLNQVDRLDREQGDKGETFFSVEFELSGPGVTGTLSALVVDPASEMTIIAEAMDMLLVGLEEFGAAAQLQRRPGTAEPREA